jgi:hypothetical protein
VSIEREIKVPVRRLDPVRAALGELGADRLEPMTFEDNLVLDDPAHALAGSGRLLRLRRWGAVATLTYKGPASFVDGVHVALDETPIGCFVELEGDDAALRALAPRLGLDPAHAVAGTYLDLWNEWRTRHPEAGPDMVFP